MNEEIQLVPDRKTYQNIAKYFEVEVSAIEDALSQLGFEENLRGRFVGKVYRASNGLEFSYDAKNQVIDKSVYIKEGYQISGYPLKQDQRDLLDAHFAPEPIPTKSWNEWANLPTDVFYQLIDSGNVSGKDLVSACVSNPQINAKCNSRNEEIFRRMLLKNYGVVSTENHRAKYIELAQTKLYGAGEWSMGQLGITQEESQRVSSKGKKFVDYFIELHALRGVRQVACSSDYTLILDGQNRVWSFGLHPEDTSSRREAMSAHLVKDAPLATQISASNTAIAIIDLEGYLWVLGDFGGIPTKNFTKLSDMRIKSVSCGMLFLMCIDLEGHVWAYGSNHRGNLGLGDRFSRKALSMLPTPERAVQVSCSEGFSAILDDEGVPWICGGGSEPEDDYSLTPIQIRCPKRIMQLAMANLEVKMIDVDGNVWWRTTNKLHLRVIDASSKWSPEVNAKFVQIAAGSEHFAAIDQKGGLWTEGLNDHGQLGQSGTYKARVEWDYVGGTRGVRQVSCGWRHTIYIA